MALFEKSVEVEVDVDIDLDPQEIYEALDDDELIELGRLINSKGSLTIEDKDYTLSNMIKHKKDDEVLEDKEFLDMLIKLMKYDNSINLEYVIDELNYGR